MLERIIRFSLNNRLFVLLGAVLLIVGGLYITQKMDIDVFPDLTAPTVVIMTDARGMATEEVERLVSFPIETAVNGATNVRRVRSASQQGYSFVWVEFDWGTDIFIARQVVSEKMVTLASSLPPDVVPVLAPQSSIMGEILFVALQADTTSMMQLRTLADWLIKPAILATGGVSQVTIIGGDYKQYQILANPQRMNLYGVTMEDLAAVGRSFSSNSSGGVLRDYGNEYILRGMARTNNIEELGASFIKRVAGRPVVVDDVAEVVIGSAIKMGDASQNASPAIILSISKQPNINTLNVTQNIEENLEGIKKSLPADVRLSTKIFRQADFIEASVQNVGTALIQGAIFVIIILFLFLGSFRTTLISVIAIPLSLLSAMIVLYLLDMNINTMSLGGLCIAIGSLVDDAIVGVENVYKRLKQNHHLPVEQRTKVWDVVFNASNEVRMPILNSTFIIMASFLPLFFLSGMEGRMLVPLGIAFLVALCASTLVALTITPLLCHMMLTGDKHLSKTQKESWLTRQLAKIYTLSLQWALQRKPLILGASIALFVLSVGLYFTMGKSFLPDFNEGSLTISVVSKPGVSLTQSSELGKLLETELMQIPEVTNTARRTGRGELDEHSQSTNSAEIDVRFMLDKRTSQDFFADVRERLSSIAGIATTVGQPLGHRIDHMLSGTRANIAIKLFGTDLSRMFMLGNQIQSTIAGIEGLVDVNLEQQTEVPQLQIRANRGRLARYGIRIEDFNRFIELAFAGEKLSEIYEGQRSFDLILRLNKDYTQSIEQIKSALIDTDSGKKIPLEEVADIVSVGGPNAISRENVQRKIVVSANVAGRDLQSVVNDIEQSIAQNIKLPEGYRIEYGGQFESAKNASRTLFITSLIAIAIIFLLLYAEFSNASLAGIVLLNLPLALIGGIFAIFFTSGMISIPAIIGFITLFGIATRNGILLISRYQRLAQQSVALHEAICTGSVDRLNPIIMTALTSALALVPLVFNGDKSGNEIQSPMAVVVLGGLITSTLLNLFVVPIVYELIEKKRMKNTA
ncbi:MAG: efflux RND transporter permease subunit [Bacteroidales bacterium]